jgi:2-phosphosulfolactate phosphatase
MADDLIPAWPAAGSPGTSPRPHPVGTPHEIMVAVDVIRAFTTAAVLLARGATEIICVRDFREVEEVAAQIPSALIVGEQRDPPFPQVDLPNSPVAAASADVTGRVFVFCTVNGTRVLAATPPGVTAIGCAAVNVGASARWILASRATAPVHVVCTDPDADEDVACAGHLAALLRGEAPDSAATRRAIVAAARVHELTWRAKVPADMWRDFVADVDVCARVDAVPVVLACTRDERGLVVMRNGSLP